MKQPILFLDQQSFRGGAQRVLEEVLRALDQDYLPIVALPEQGPFAAELRARNIEILIYPLGRYRPGRKSAPEIMAFAARSVYCGLKLARIIFQRKIRMVYINGPRCLLAGVLAARLTGRPSLFHLHRALTRRTDRFLAVRSARHISKIVACSEAAATALLSTPSRLARITQVIYNPLRQLAPGMPFASPSSLPAAPLKTTGRFVVGVVGRITREKGQHVLLRAAGRLKGRGQDLQVVFVGAPAPHSPEDASYRCSLESSARELGLEGNVFWAGYQADPNPYYARFDVLAIPSTASEGFPLVALEAMQCGVPVVASRTGGIPEVVREGVNGLLVPPGDEQALAASLERVLSDSTLRTRLQAGARASIDNRFSPETFRSAIRSVVTELCPPARTLEAETKAREAEARA